MRKHFIYKDIINDVCKKLDISLDDFNEDLVKFIIDEGINEIEFDKWEELKEIHENWKRRIEHEKKKKHHV